MNILKNSSECSTCFGVRSMSSKVTPFECFTCYGMHSMNQINIQNTYIKDNRNRQKRFHLIWCLSIILMNIVINKLKLCLIVVLRHNIDVVQLTPSGRYTCSGIRLMESADVTYWGTAKTKMRQLWLPLGWCGKTI